MSAVIGCWESGHDQMTSEDSQGLYSGNIYSPATLLGRQLAGDIFMDLINAHE